MFVFSIIAGFIAMIPLLSTWIVCIPASLYLYYSKRHLIHIALLWFVYYKASRKTFNDIYEKEYEKVKVPPFVTEMCVFLGAYEFGVKGIIFGPLLTSFIMIIYDLIRDYSPDIKSSIKRLSMIGM